MINISKFDIVVIKFPFASSLKYKARPAVVVSSTIYNKNQRDTVMIMAISSSLKNKLDFELTVQEWEEAGLLKKSIFKSSIVTIEKSFIVNKLGRLNVTDRQRLEGMIEIIC